jgi:hypothetical protein
MTKNKNVYTMPLQVLPDGRATHTVADRRAQFDLAMKLYRLLGDMTFAVDRIQGMRLALASRAAQLPAGDPLIARLQAAASQLDELRKKIVATKEGGAITGEERLRENLADLYGNVARYEGRPSQTQVERSDAIARELRDVVKDFDNWMAKNLADINASLTAKQLKPIEAIGRADWEK